MECKDCIFWRKEHEFHDGSAVGTCDNQSRDVPSKDTWDDDTCDHFQKEREH